MDEKMLNEVNNVKNIKLGDKNWNFVASRKTTTRKSR
jgi:hypothetical protein